MLALWVGLIVVGGVVDTAPLTIVASVAVLALVAFGLWWIEHTDTDPNHTSFSEHEQCEEDGDE